LLSRAFTRHIAIASGLTRNLSSRFQHLTALSAAASSGHTEIVQLLLDKGANINAADLNGGTALYYADWNGHTEIVQLLLERTNVNV
jgi:ankyrin repeat protein